MTQPIFSGKRGLVVSLFFFFIDTYRRKWYI